MSKPTDFRMIDLNEPPAGLSPEAIEFLRVHAMPPLGETLYQGEDGDEEEPKKSITLQDLRCFVYETQEAPGDLPISGHIDRRIDAVLTYVRYSDGGGITEPYLDFGVHDADFDE